MTSTAGDIANLDELELLIADTPLRKLQCREKDAQKALKVSDSWSLFRSIDIMNLKWRLSSKEPATYPPRFQNIALSVLCVGWWYLGQSSAPSRGSCIVQDVRSYGSVCRGKQAPNVARRYSLQARKDLCHSPVYSTDKQPLQQVGIMHHCLQCIRIHKHDGFTFDCPVGSLWTCNVTL